MSIWDDWTSGWRKGLRRGLAQGSRLLLVLAERVAPSATAVSPEQHQEPADVPTDDSPPPGGPPAHWLARLPADEPPADWLARVEGLKLEELQAVAAEQPTASDSARPADRGAEAAKKATALPVAQLASPPKRPLPSFPPRRTRTRPLRFRWPEQPEQPVAPTPAEAADPMAAAPPPRADFPAAAPPERQRSRLRFLARPDGDPSAPPAFAEATQPAAVTPSFPSRPTLEPQRAAADNREAVLETAVTHPPTPSFPDRPSATTRPTPAWHESEASHHAKPVDLATGQPADLPDPPQSRPAPPFPEQMPPLKPARPRWPNLPTPPRADPTWPAAFRPRRSTSATSQPQRETGGTPNPARGPAWPDRPSSSVVGPPPFPPTVTADYWPDLPDDITPTTNEWEQSRRRWQRWHRLTQEQEGEAWNGSSS